MRSFTLHSLDVCCSGIAPCRIWRHILKRQKTQMSFHGTQRPKNSGLDCSVSPTLGGNYRTNLDAMPGNGNLMLIDSFWRNW